MTERAAHAAGARGHHEKEAGPAGSSFDDLASQPVDKLVMAKMVVHINFRHLHACM